MHWIHAQGRGPSRLYNGVTVEYVRLVNRGVELLLKRRYADKICYSKLNHGNIKIATDLVNLHIIVNLVNLVSADRLVFI